MENNQEVVTKKDTVKKVLTIILNVLFYLFIAFLLIFAIANLSGKENKVPRLFGYSFMSVQTTSMEGNNKDSFNAGDLVIVKAVNDKTIENLKVGDVITFKDYNLDPKSNQLNTHRIVYIGTNDEGSKYYILQGDEVATKYPNRVFETKEQYDEDINVRMTCQLIGKDEIIAKYSSKITNGGKTLTYLQSKQGFGLCIVLPTGLLLLLEAYILVKNLLVLNRQKLEAEMAEKAEAEKEDLEAQKEKMRQEILAEMEAKKNNEENKNE